MLLSLPAFTLLRLLQVLLSGLLAALLVFCLLVGVGAMGGAGMADPSLGLPSFWAWLVELPQTPVTSLVSKPELVTWLSSQVSTILAAGLVLLSVVVLLGIGLSIFEAYRITPRLADAPVDLAAYAAGRLQPPGPLGRGLRKGLAWAFALGRHGLFPALLWLLILGAQPGHQTETLSAVLLHAVSHQESALLAGLAVYTAWAAISLRGLLLWLEGAYHPNRRRVLLLERVQA